MSFLWKLGGEIAAFVLSNTSCRVKPTGLLSLISEGFVRGRYVVFSGSLRIDCVAYFFSRQHSVSRLGDRSTYCLLISAQQSLCSLTEWPNQLPAWRTWIHPVIIWEFKTCCKSDEVAGLLFIYIRLSAVKNSVGSCPKEWTELLLWYTLWLQLLMLVLVWQMQDNRWRQTTGVGLVSHISDFKDKPPLELQNSLVF